MGDRPFRAAIIAGEVSGDLLGGDLAAALKMRLGDRPLELVGVGGEALEAEGLVSLFDFSELSIMGITQVLARLPQLVRRIRQTAAAIVAARPDVLIIIDSPDFTHRVARKVRKALPDLPVVNYVCPSVWAWKPERAQRMRAYVDHVLAVLPFEPAAMQALAGPPTTYVGHRLTVDRDVLTVREKRARRTAGDMSEGRTCLLLPGSRSTEINRLLPLFGEAVVELSLRNPGMRFILPAVPRQEQRVRAMTADWSIQPEIRVGAVEKWQAFAQADAAIAASGTVILELALCGIPTVSTYKVDWLIRLMARRITIWTAAIPNLIADYAVVPEYINESIRAGSLTRWVERLTSDTLQRSAMMDGYDLVWKRMATEKPPGEKAAEVVLDIANKKSPVQ